MANTEIIDSIIASVSELITYMLPIIALLTGVSFVFSFLISVTLGWGKKTFRD